MTSPRSIIVAGPNKTTLKRMLASIPANADRAPEARSLAREIFRMCKKHGNLNALAIWAIVLHETGIFGTLVPSAAWKERLNPCGLWDKNFTGYQRFTSGVEAARAMVVHALIYTQGRAGMFGLYRRLDPGAARVDAAGFAGTVTTLEDFRDKWAEDHEWPEKVAGHYDRVRLMDVVDRDTPATTHRYGFRRSIVPPGAVNHSGLTLDAAYFVVHETANRSFGADAEMHRQFVHNGGGPEHVSFHAVVDDEEVIQLFEYDTVTWQAGDGYYGPGNRRGESLEICVNADGDWLETIHNAAHYVADRLHARGWTVAHLRPGQHANYMIKDCPNKLRNGEGGVTWPQFVALVQFYYDAGAGKVAA